MSIERVILVTNTMRQGGGGKYVSETANVLSHLKYELFIYSYDNSPSYYNLNSEIKTIYGKHNYFQHYNFIARLFRRIYWLFAARNYINTKLKGNRTKTIVIAFTSDIIIDLLILNFIIRSNLISVEIGNPYHISGLRKIVYFWFLRKQERIVVLTNKLKIDLINDGFEKSKIYVIPGFAKFVSNKHYNADSKKIISAGKLIASKGFHNLIVSFSLFQAYEIFRDYRLYIYGDGPEKNSLEVLIAQLKLEDVVKLRGSTNSLEEELKDSALFIYSSVSEGFCYVILEAMSSGLPIISTRFEYGSEQLIMNNGNGFLVSIDNPTELSNAIVEILKSKNKMIQYSNSSVELALKFNPKSIALTWKNLINGLDE